MSFSPPASPPPVRPMSGRYQTGRSASRMSMMGKPGPGSRASDEDGKTLVKVGRLLEDQLNPLPRETPKIADDYSQLSVYDRR